MENHRSVTHQKKSGKQSGAGDVPAALDVTVIFTLQSLTLAGAEATQGHALRVGEVYVLTTRYVCLWAWFSFPSSPLVAGAMRQSTTSPELAAFWETRLNTKATN
jgi:hypothetical protein